ncbi:MAG TPA: hypothetical protein PKA64_22540, partial [Myxococcota bacterium]|nr:hypothetical protein [Myxococcota bacterium]
MTTLTFALAAALINPARALTYDEAVEGEITGTTAAPTPIGQLEVGDNLLIGTALRSDDAVSMSLPLGTRVAEAWIDATRFVSFGGVGIVRFFRITPFQPLGGASIPSDYSAALPVVNMTPKAPFGFQAEPGNTSFDYRLRVTVESTCAGGEILWDEAVDGDIPGTEASPTDLGALGPGRYVVCGGVDPRSDSVTIRPGDYARVASVTVQAADLTVLSDLGYARLFQSTPPRTVSTVDMRADGAYALSTGALDPTLPVGLTAAAHSDGATYGYQAVIVVEDTRPTLTTPTPPVAGQTATFDMAGLTPGGTVYLAASLRPG